MIKITEAEITSMCRRFFLKNGFRFLSTLQNGEKLYYTLNGILIQRKQPDTIVTKDDLVVVCEDKIKYASTYSDQIKLTTFLMSPFDIELFKNQLRLCKDINENVLLIGCVSSLAPSKGYKDLTLPPDIIRIYFTHSEGIIFKSTLQAPLEFINYFPYPVIELAV